MDVLELVEKVKAIKADVEARIEVIKSKYNNFAQRINDLIDKLENIINSVIDEINAGIAGALNWAQDKLTQLVYKINRVLDNMEQYIDKKLMELQTWLDDLLNRIKITFVQSALAKLGVELTKEEAQPIADAIPLDIPTIDSSIFNFELPLPDLVTMFNMRLEGKELPRMPLL